MSLKPGSDYTGFKILADFDIGLRHTHTHTRRDFTDVLSNRRRALATRFFRLIERHALRAVIETTVQQKAVHHLMSRDLKGGRYEQNGDWRGATNCR